MEERQKRKRIFWRSLDNFFLKRGNPLKCRRFSPVKRHIQTLKIYIKQSLNIKKIIYMKKNLQCQVDQHKEEGWHWNLVTKQHYYVLQIHISFHLHQNLLQYLIEERKEKKTYKYELKYIKNKTCIYVLAWTCYLSILR